MATSTRTTPAPIAAPARAPQRRSILAALFVAPVAAATPALAAMQAPAAAESPEVLALGDQLAAATEAMNAALARQEAARAAFEASCPAPPADLIPGPEARGIARDLTLDIDLPGSGYTTIYCWRQVKAEIILRDISRHSNKGRRLRHIARIGKAYDAAYSAAYDAAGIDRHTQEATHHAATLLALSKQAAALSPATLAGALILARALPAIATAASTVGYREPMPQEREIAARLAEAVVRIGGGSPQAAGA